MTNDDVYPDDMNPTLSDEQLERLLTGRVDQNLIDHPVAAILAGGMEKLRDLPAATPSQALSEFVGVMSAPPPIASPPAQIFDLRPRSARQRKTKMFTSLTALVATTTGKLALGATVAAAAVGGAQVTGVVDVVPDLGNKVEVVAAGPAIDESEELPVVIPEAGLPASEEIEQPPVVVPEVDLPVTEEISDPNGTDVDESDEGNGSMLNQTIIFPIDGVGSVTVEVVDGVLTATAEVIDPWTATVDVDHDEVELRFTDGTRDVEVEAEIEDGVLRITVKGNGKKVETFFDEDGNEIDKPVEADDDESDHDEDDEDDVEDESDQDEEESDQDHDDDDDDDDDDDSDRDEDESDHDDDD